MPFDHPTNLASLLLNIADATELKDVFIVIHYQING
jgi:hypothetical protein